MTEPVNLGDPEAWAEALRRSRLPRVSVVCTGKGRHGQATLARFDIDTDGPHEVPARQIPYRGGTADDGATVGNRATVAAESTRDDYGDQIRYRFTCPRRECTGDVQVNADRLVRLLAGMAHGDTLDVSELRR